MGGRPVEIILMRQLASYLAVPMVIVDTEGDLLFYNESAEPIFGRRFDETGELQQGEWRGIFKPADADGVPIPPEEQALSRALERNEPSHRRIWLTGLDGVARVIEGLALPIATCDGGLLGAAGIFWEIRRGAQPLSISPAPDLAPKTPHHAVEVVLLRRLAERLALATIVLDADGRVAFYNPAAEELIGRPFHEVGRIVLAELFDTFQPTDDEGSRMKREDHPLYLALMHLRPTHREFWFQGLDGVRRRIAGTAFPLVGQCDRLLGAVGVFWEGQS